MHNIPFSNGNIVMSCNADGVCITRHNDGLRIQTFFSPYETGACAMALLTDDHRQEGRLRNSSCRVLLNGNSSPTAICDIHPVSLRSRSSEEKQKSMQFSEKTAPLKAMMNIRVLSGDNTDIANIRVGLTSLDLVRLTCLAVTCWKETVIVGISITARNTSEGLELRCGGSEWRKIGEHERRRLVTKLRQWLSGDRSRFVTFNAQGLHFNRRPRLIVNNVSTHPLSFTEVAQLYLLLETCHGHEPDVPALLQASSRP